MSKKNQTGSFSKFASHFEFISVWKPMVYALVFSAVYAFVYLQIAGISSDQLRMALCIPWLSCYGLSWYFVSGMVWGKKHGMLSIKKMLIAFLWFLVFNVILYGVISPLYTLVMLSQQSILILLLQLVAAALIILWIPATIMLFRGLYEDVTSIKKLAAGIWKSFVNHASRLLNYWLCLFFILVFWDSLIAGPLSIEFGFNAFFLLSNLVSLSSSLCYPIILLQALNGMITSGYAYILVLTILFGFFANWLEINLIRNLGKFWD